MKKPGKSDSRPEYRRADLGRVVRGKHFMDWTDYISMDAEICHGKPCSKGSRILVADILELWEAGDSLAEIKLSFPRLTRNHIQAALQFSRQTAKR